MWEIWYEGEKISEHAELHLAQQFVAGFGKTCELRRAIDPAKLAGVTESVT